MKKGALTAVVLFVLVVGILGAVLLYSGMSGTTGAVHVTGEDTSGSSEFSLEENNGNCECRVWCDPTGNTDPNTHGFSSDDSISCVCKTTDANPCDTACATFLSEVSAENSEFTCALKEKASKCTKDPECDKSVKVCHCPNNQKCRTINVKPAAVHAHVGSSAHPPGKDTLGPCPADTTTTTTSTTDTTVQPSSTTTTVTVPSTTVTTEPPSSTSTTSTPPTTVTTETPGTTTTTVTPSTTVTTTPSTTSST